MSVRNTKDGSKKPWLCECYPQGREGKRVRKRFATKGEANAFELHTLKNVDNKPWLGEKVDNRRLSEIIQLWYDLHGSQLANAEHRLRRVKQVCIGLGDPIASKIKVNDFAKYRQMRLNGEVPDLNGRKMKVKPATVNNDKLVLNAMFNSLHKLGEISYPSPIEGVSAFKVSESELAFLYPEEITRLLEACEKAWYEHLRLMTKICLSTGCRWSECENLSGSNIVNNRITFTKTKSGKNRTIPISEELAAEIPKTKGKLFRPCITAFRGALKRAKIKLPEGQATHVLRHTFASHFMMNGGNILVLKQILGHADIKMTMRYAHFAPAHLEDAVTKNPLTSI